MFGTENKLKNSTLISNEHFLSSPEEKEIQRKNKEFAETKK